MKYFIFALLLSFIIACGKGVIIDEQPIDTTPVLVIPDCLEVQVASETNMRIVSQKLDGESHFWILDDDAPESSNRYIVNELCDTVCYSGNFGNPTCYDAYDFDSWLIVWQQ